MKGANERWPTRRPPSGAPLLRSVLVRELLFFQIPNRAFAR
jgi:hypothetical protein